MSHATPISDDQFSNLIEQSNLPVLVDFWAPWCGPCKMIAPVLDEIAKELNGRLTIVKMNVDENPQTPAQFGVRGIPSLLIFKHGELAGTHVGAVSKSDLMAFINPHL